MSFFKWKHFLFRKRGLGKIDEIFEPEVEKQAFKGDLAGGPELGDRNVNGATDSRTREGTGQDRMGPLFGSAEEKGRGGKLVPGGEVLLFWLDLWSLSHGHGKRRRGNWHQSSSTRSGFSHWHCGEKSAFLKMRRRSRRTGSGAAVRVQSWGRSWCSAC